MMWREKITTCCVWRMSWWTGEQAFWSYNDQKPDVLELFGSSSGFSWMMARKGVKVGQPIDHKHGSNFNAAFGQSLAWKTIKKMIPEPILSTLHLLSQQGRWFPVFILKSSYGSVKGKKKFVVTCPEQFYFAQFLDQKRWHKVLNSHLWWKRMDIQHPCNL